ncbi:hypothetical protein [Methylobacterium sp. 22177]|uniref:hypothetical protein n=1 Tax=Methylobacterium sp. 22177 TaxID=3453885 RepID=UPI003F85EBE3
MGKLRLRFRSIASYISTAVVIILFLGFELSPLFFNRADPPPDPTQYKCPEGSPDDPRHIRRPNDSIKVIRLTNAGEFARRCDFTNALYETNWNRVSSQKPFGVEVDPDAPKDRPKLVVLFVHGWKHSANENDDNYKSFTELIKALRSKYGDQRYVVGIYIGWNGDANLGDALDNITFWAKKNNADRIAQSNAVTTITSAVGAIIRADPAKRDRFIAIGHSFGARLLFAATAPSLLAAAQMAHPGRPYSTYKVFRGIADAVILLNPAFEASRYTAFDNLSRVEEAFSPEQPPLLVTLSTSADWPTRKAFPIGQWLGLARSSRELMTLGNYSPYRTHIFTERHGSSCTDGDTTRSGEIDNLEIGPVCLIRINREDKRVKAGDNPAATSPYNPFMVARTGPEIMSGHGDIWNPKIRGWLVDLVALLEQEHSNILAVKDPASKETADPKSPQSR